MKKITLFAFLSMLVFISCSDDDKEMDPVNPVDATLRLKAEKTIIEPFEKLTVRIDLDEDLIYSEYDSVRWDAAGLWWDGIITIPNNEDPRDVHFTNYRLGKHKIILNGYKDGKVISSPSVEYEVVKPRGDFLNVRWGVEVKFNTVIFRAGQTPLNYLETVEGWVEIGGVSIKRWHIVDSGKGEYAHLFLEPWSFSSNLRVNRSIMPDVPFIEEDDWHPKKTGNWDLDHANYTKRCESETEFWYNYILALYGEPILEYQGNDPSETILWDEYKSRFNNLPRDGAFPCVIWETPRSYIAMNHHKNSIRGKGIFKGLPSILAEPRYK